MLRNRQTTTLGWQVLHLCSVIFNNLDQIPLPPMVTVQWPCPPFALWTVWGIYLETRATPQWSPSSPAQTSRASPRLNPPPHLPPPWAILDLVQEGAWARQPQSQNSEEVVPPRTKLSNKIVTKYFLESTIRWYFWIPDEMMVSVCREIWPICLEAASVSSPSPQASCMRRELENFPPSSSHGSASWRPPPYSRLASDTASILP